MSTQILDSKRIAKNTLMLYVRMLFTLIVSLFTTRVVLDTLGASDYGIYNLVGGIVGLMGIVTALLSQGTTRFITISLGKGDRESLKSTFLSSLSIHILFALIILIIGEAIGPWAIGKLNIPVERIGAARFVFHLSLVTSLINIIQTPFNACIVAHERMNIYAYISIWDAVAKLLIVYLLVISEVDKLKLYSFLYLAVGVITAIIYFQYCKKHFEECRTYSFRFDKKLYKEIFNYTSWNAIGTLAFTLNNQGMTVLLNAFGTIVNAARGISLNVSNVVYRFVESFQAAARPQITKLCAVKDYDSMNGLIIRTSKYSSYLIGIIGVPLFIEMDFVLRLWLKEVPEYTIIFTRLTIIQAFIQSVDFPIGAGIHAVGKMKLPNITSSIIYMMILPVSYVAIKVGASPVIAYIMIIAVYPLALMTDMLILHKFTSFCIKTFLWNVLARAIFILPLVGYLTFRISSHLPQSFVRLIITVVISICLNSLLIYFLGISRGERRYINDYIYLKIRLKRSDE